MKSPYLTAALIAYAAFVTPAFAAEDGDAFTSGDSAGPRYRSQQPYYAQTAQQTPAKTPSWLEDRAWVNNGQSTKGFVDPRPYELAEQMAANEAHARRTYDRVIEAGGCNAPVVPFEYASYCGKDAFGNGMHGSD